LINVQLIIIQNLIGKRRIVVSAIDVVAQSEATLTLGINGSKRKKKQMLTRS